MDTCVHRNFPKLVGSLTWMIMRIVSRELTMVSQVTMDADGWNVILLAGSQSLCLEKYPRLPKVTAAMLCGSSDVTTVTARCG